MKDQLKRWRFILQFCIEHGSMTVMPSAKFENDNLNLVSQM